MGDVEILEGKEAEVAKAQIDAVPLEGETKPRSNVFEVDGAVVQTEGYEPSVLEVRFYRLVAYLEKTGVIPVGALTPSKDEAP